MSKGNTFYKHGLTSNQLTEKCSVNKKISSVAYLFLQTLDFVSHINHE